MKNFSRSFLGSVTIGVLFISGFSAHASGITASELCKLYGTGLPSSAKDRSAEATKYASQIRLDCEGQDGGALREKSRLPVYNFRPVFGVSDPEQRIFRGGQPLGDESDPNYAGEESKKRDFKLDALKSELGQGGVVVSLRFDRHFEPWEKVFGKTESLPLSSGESPYRFAAEKALVEKQGLKSLYLPTIPEMESFVGNYVPMLDQGAGSKPYFCRFPVNFPDGAEEHWINESTDYTEHAADWEKKGITGPLVSADPECGDLIPVYGKEKVRSWLKRVRETVRQADRVFWQDAEKIERIAREKKKVMFHCSSGTDRAGLVAMILEAKHDHLTKKELAGYRGPGTDSKIDLITLHYLISQWAGNSPQYSNLFPPGGRPGLITRAVK